MSSPLVRQLPGTKKTQLTTLQKNPNWIGFLFVSYLCRSHGIQESLRIPTLQVGPSSTRWRKLRQPFFHVYYKEGQKCLIFEKVLIDSRTHDLAIKQAVDFLFTLMRRETTRDGSLKAWFENRQGKVEYSVAREEVGDN